jgi:hypothetical protein
LAAYNGGAYILYLYARVASFLYKNKMTPLDPNGIVWALSAISVVTVVGFVYFAIFWMFMYLVFFGLAEVFRGIYKMLSFTL